MITIGVGVRRTILDLCAGTGAWSEPYHEAGYAVERITLPLQDVRMFRYPTSDIHGILAAPPCQYFCRMRMCHGRPTDAQFQEALSVVDACLRLVAMCQPAWWALENPAGYLGQWLGPPRLKFDPWEYGDPWTKRTWVWGQFKLPVRAPIPPRDSLVRKHVPGSRQQTGIAKTAEARSRTPHGFAAAFFRANL